MRGSAAGFTLLEVLAASVLASVVAGGMMMAYIAAARMPPPRGIDPMLEANGLAQQTLEWIRNQVAADSTFFATQAAAGWQEDPLPAAGSSESILNQTAVRRYCVRTADCAGVGDCYAADAKVCWNGTPCPAIGSVCS